MFMIWILASSQGSVQSPSASAGMLFFVFSHSLLIIASTSQLKNTYIYEQWLYYALLKSQRLQSGSLQRCSYKHYNKYYKFLNFLAFLRNETWLNKPHLLCLSLESHKAPFWQVWAFCISSATWFMFSLVHLASCVTLSWGLNCSESIDIVKMIESNTVIRFLENFTEDIKEKNVWLT